MTVAFPDTQTGAMDACAGGILTVDVGAIATNWRRLSARAPSSECAAVVKANAYGTGIETTVPALARAGCKTFFVALPHEGERVRRICAASDNLRPERPDARTSRLSWPNIGCARSWDPPRRFPIGRPSSARTTSSGHAAIHVDTGMNRLGLTPRDAMAWARRAKVFKPGFPISLLMTHLVASESPENPVNERQVEIFSALRQAFPGVPGSLSNSSGIFLGGAPTTMSYGPAMRSTVEIPCHPRSIRWRRW